jgi:hypothetical protein
LTSAGVLSAREFVIIEAVKTLAAIAIGGLAFFMSGD